MCIRRRRSGIPPSRMRSSGTRTTRSPDGFDRTMIWLSLAGGRSQTAPRDRAAPASTICIATMGANGGAPDGHVAPDRRSLDYAITIGLCRLPAELRRRSLLVYFKTYDFVLNYQTTRYPTRQSITAVICCPYSMSAKDRGVPLAAGRSPGQTSGGGDAAEMGSLTTLLWSEARAAWPSVELSEEAFTAHVALHLPAHLPALDAIEKMHTADLYLTCACAMGDAHAIAAFENQCLRGIDVVLARLRIRADLVPEI